MQYSLTKIQGKGIVMGVNPSFNLIFFLMVTLYVTLLSMKTTVN